MPSRLTSFIPSALANTNTERPKKKMYIKTFGIIQAILSLIFGLFMLAPPLVNFPYFYTFLCIGKCFKLFIYCLLRSSKKLFETFAFMSQLSLITYDYQSVFNWTYLQLDSRLIIHLKRHVVIVVRAGISPNLGPFIHDHDGTLYDF